VKVNFLELMEQGFVSHNTLPMLFIWSQQQMGRPAETVAVAWPYSCC